MPTDANLRAAAPDLLAACKAAENSLYDCTYDMAQWRQLANYQREKSDNPNYDPLCATERAIAITNERLADAYSVLQQVRTAVKKAMGSVEKTDGYYSEMG